MATFTGRALRVLAGLVLIAIGALALEGTAATILVVIGFVPLLAGLANVCLISPLIGAPFQGKDLPSPSTRAQSHA
jgi:hypothetical protein